MTTLPRPVMRLFRALPEAVRQRAVRTVAPSYTLGAQARVTREDGRVLLVKAAYRWRWGMPGGLMDAGESPADAVVRETLEETGVPIVLTSEPLVLVETSMQRVNFIYEAEPAPGVDADDLSEPNDEILELGWFDADDLPETIPDMSGELSLRQNTLDKFAAVVVTGEVQWDERPPSG